MGEWESHKTLIIASNRGPCFDTGLIFTRGGIGVDLEEVEQACVVG